MGLSSILFLQFAEFAPADILVHLSEVGVFFALEPEPEPIDKALLRDDALKRFHKRVGRIGKKNVFNGFLLKR